MNILAILGIFRPCFYIYFLWKMTFSNPPTPLKYEKFHTFFFEGFPYYLFQKDLLTENDLFEVCTGNGIHLIHLYHC